MSKDAKNPSYRRPRGEISCDGRGAPRVVAGPSSASQDVSLGPAAGVPHFLPATGTDPSTEPIVVKLSGAQVDEVVRAASWAGNLSLLLSGLRDLREASEAGSALLHDSRLSGSLLAGLLVLASLPEDGQPLRNKDIARMLDMSTSTVHRYLPTLVAVALVERDPRTRRYKLARLHSVPVGVT